jgi:predicted ester cyclase
VTKSSAKNDGESPGAETSKALLRRITDDIWTNGRLDLVDELVAEDFVDHVELSGLEGNGRERYRASVVAIRSAFPDYREEILFLVGEGDVAVSYVRGSGTHKGSLYGIEPTGRRAEWQAMGALRFRDGQAVERWGVGDSLGMMQQLGVFG